MWLKQLYAFYVLRFNHGSPTFISFPDLAVASVLWYSKAITHFLFSHRINNLSKTLMSYQIEITLALRIIISSSMIWLAL